MNFFCQRKEHSFEYLFEIKEGTVSLTAVFCASPLITQLALAVYQRLDGTWNVDSRPVCMTKKCAARQVYSFLAYNSSTSSRKIVYFFIVLK